jgi:hypothetical protein
MNILRNRLDQEAWGAVGQGQYLNGLSKVVLEAGRLMLKAGGLEPALGAATPEALAFHLPQVPEYHAIVAAIAACRDKSAENEAWKVRQLHISVQNLLDRLEDLARREARESVPGWDADPWLPWLGAAALLVVLGIGWWRMTAPISPAPINTELFIKRLEQVSEAVLKWRHDQADIAPLAPETGEAQALLVSTDFDTQLTTRLGETGRWRSWRGPYSEPLSFAPEIGKAQLVNTPCATFDLNGDGRKDIPQGTRTVYVSFSGVAPAAWKAIDLALDRGIGTDDPGRMTTGRVVYLPWNEWMAIFLLNDREAAATGPATKPGG